MDDRRAEWYCQTDVLAGKLPVVVGVAIAACVAVLRLIGMEDVAKALQVHRDDVLREAGDQLMPDRVPSARRKQQTQHK